MLEFIRYEGGFDGPTLRDDWCREVGTLRVHTAWLYFYYEVCTVVHPLYAMLFARRCFDAAYGGMCTRCLLRCAVPAVR